VVPGGKADGKIRPQLWGMSQYTIDKITMAVVIASCVACWLIGAQLWMLAWSL
jgi:uncharacterized membrane protein (GlpM family)